MRQADTYKQKLEATIEVAHARLSLLKAKAKSATADVKIKLNREIEEVEKMTHSTKTKIIEIADAGVDVWKELAANVEITWNQINKFTDEDVKK